jgi:hypothetical protein
VEAHDGAFSVENIESGFRGTGIFPYNRCKVLDRVKLTIQDCIEIRPLTPIETATPFTESVLTSSPLNTEEARSANAALLSQITAGGVLSTPARNYAKCVIQRSERVQVRNIIIEEEHNKLKMAVTRRKTILSGKRKSIDGRHILTSAEILAEIEEAERNTKRRRTNKGKKGKRTGSQVAEDSTEESEASQDEMVVVLDCIEVEQ